MAMGFTGEPVPRGIGNGAIVTMNSQRFRAAAASLSASKSARSRTPMPRIARAKLWMASGMMSPSGCGA